MDVTIVVVHITCAACCMDFFITEGFLKKVKASHESFYCPKGHKNYFPQKSEVEILRERLTESEKRNSNLREVRDSYHEQLQQEKRSKAAHKANYTRLKQRFEKKT